MVNPFGHDEGRGVQIPGTFQTAKRRGERSSGPPASKPQQSSGWSVAALGVRCSFEAVREAAYLMHRSSYLKLELELLFLLAPATPAFRAEMVSNGGAGRVLAAGPEPKRRRISARDVVRSKGTRRAAAGDGKELPAVTVSVVQWCGDSRFFFPTASAGTPLYQIQVVHDSRPSITFGFSAAFRAFLPEIDPELQTFADLEQKRNIRVVMSGGAEECDPDAIGVKQWRAALYAATKEPAAVLDMLSAFVENKQRAAEFAGYQLQMEVSRSAEKIFTGGLPHPWSWMPGGSLGPRPFEAAPVRGKHHMILQVEREDDVPDSHALTFAGGTWAFREAFDAAEVEGGHVDVGGEREYVRCLRSLKFDTAGKERIQNILGAACLCDHVLYLDNQTGDASDEVVKWLSTFHHVFSN